MLHTPTEVGAPQAGEHEKRNQMKRLKSSPEVTLEPDTNDQHYLRITERKYKDTMCSARH
jgi:hypothetical protein